MAGEGQPLLDPRAADPEEANGGGLGLLGGILIMPRLVGFAVAYGIYSWGATKAYDTHLAKLQGATRCGDGVWSRRGPICMALPGLLPLLDDGELGERVPDGLQGQGDEAECRRPIHFDGISHMRAPRGGNDVCSRVQLVFDCF